MKKAIASIAAAALIATATPAAAQAQPAQLNAEQLYELLSLDLTEDTGTTFGLSTDAILATVVFGFIYAVYSMATGAQTSSVGR